MEYYDKLLTIGQHLSPERQFELYEFLRQENSKIYQNLLEVLRVKKVAYREIANAEIKFELKNGVISNYVREKNGQYLEGNRKICINFVGLNKKQKIINYFAQCDVDAISNFPILNDVEKAFSSYEIIAYPFYSLEFYSQGNGKLLGLMKRKKRIIEIQSYLAKMNSLGLY